MANPNQKIEDKLDRYYDDLMGKLMEVVECHIRLTGENKDLKKEVSKMRESILQIQADVEGLSTFIRQNKPVTEFKIQPSPEESPKSSSPVSPVPPPASPSSPSSPSSVPSPSQGAKEIEKAGESKQRSLSQFLEDEISIFDVKVLNAFIKATKEIFAANLGEEPQFLKPRVEKNLKVPIVVVGKMNLTRDQKGNGSMAVAFEKKSIEIIAAKILMMPLDSKPLTRDCLDVTSEMCNQVCGKSKILLKTDGYNFDIALPEVSAGTTEQMYQKLGIPKIALHFKYKNESFYILFWG